MAAKAQRTKEELFENYTIPHAVLVLSVPTILSSIVMVLYNLADTYFVGMLNDPVQTAAVTLASPVLLAFNTITNLFGVGSSSMMSRAMGRKDNQTVLRSSTFGFWGALVCGVLFSLLCTLLRTPLLGLLGASGETVDPTNAYLNWTVTLGAVPAILNVVMAYLIRSEGAALHASIGTMSGCLLNMILDPIFILPWGFGMKAAGAALATFLSNCVALGYFLVYLRVRGERTCVNISLRQLRLDRSVLSGIFGVGVPASIQNILNVTSSTVMNNLAAVYGAQALAAMGICTKINMIPLYVMMGLSQGIMPLISYNYASGNIRRMKRAYFFTFRAGLIGLVSTSIIFYFGADFLVGMFISNEQTVAYGVHFLRGFCLGLPLLSMDFLAVGVFQAIGMGSKALVFAISRKLVLELPLLYLLNRIAPLYGIPYAQPITELILSIVANTLLLRFLSKAQREAELCGEK